MTQLLTKLNVGFPDFVPPTPASPLPAPNQSRDFFYASGGFGRQLRTPQNKIFHPVFPRPRITCDNAFMFPSWSRHETLCRGGSQRFRCLSVTCGQMLEGSEDTAGVNLPQLFPSQVRACGLGQPCKRPVSGVQRNRSSGQTGFPRQTLLVTRNAEPKTIYKRRRCVSRGPPFTHQSGAGLLAERPFAPVIRSELKIGDRGSAMFNSCEPNRRPGCKVEVAATKIFSGPGDMSGVEGTTGNCMGPFFDC